MKGKAILMMMVVLTASASTANKTLTPGDLLPELHGSFLTGRAAVLPQASSGKMALLLFGFSYDSRFSVEPWAARFRSEYGSNPGVTFFEIPMISGMAVMGKWFIDSGMRRGTPKADQEHVITVYGGADRWKQQLGFHDPKAAYLVLLDTQGKIIWSYTGNVTEDAFHSLSRAMNNGLIAK